MKVSNHCEPQTQHCHGHNPQVSTSRDFARMYQQMSSRYHNENNRHDSHKSAHGNAHSQAQNSRGGNDEHLRCHEHMKHNSCITQIRVITIVAHQYTESCNHQHICTPKQGYTPALQRSPTPDKPTYPRSIDDIPSANFHHIRTQALYASSNLDTRGMSVDEIFKKLEQLFKDYFGKDFQDASSAKSSKSSELTDRRDLIFQTFRAELSNHGLNKDMACYGSRKDYNDPRYPKC